MKYTSLYFRSIEWHAKNVLKILHYMILSICVWLFCCGLPIFTTNCKHISASQPKTEASKFLYNLDTEVSMTPLARTSSLKCACPGLQIVIKVMLPHTASKKYLWSQRWAGELTKFQSLPSIWWPQMIFESRAHNMILVTQYGKCTHHAWKAPMFPSFLHFDVWKNK